MEKKIYVVLSSEGQWEDYHEWIEKAFRRKKDAEAYAKQLDKEHNPKPVFKDRLWDEAEESWWSMNEEKYGKDWDLSPYDYKEEKEKNDQFYKELEERQDAFMLDYINKHSKKQYTADDIAKHKLYDENYLFQWDPGRVKEVMLVEP